MSDDKRFEIAKEYVDRQFETMRACGAAPRDISEEEYKSLVEEAAEMIKD